MIRALVAVLCAFVLVLVASLLPVVPVEATSVAPPIPDHDGTYQHSHARAEIVAPAELFSGKTGVSYRLTLGSLGVVIVLLVLVFLSIRVVARKILRPAERAKTGR